MKLESFTMQKKTIRWLAVGSVVMVGVGMVMLRAKSPATPGSASAPNPSSSMTAPNPTIGAHKIQIQLGTISDGIQATGVLQPFIKLDVGVQVSGQVETIPVELGDRVKKGDLLATIDPNIAITELHEKEGMLAQQMTELSSRELDLVQVRKEFARQTQLASHDAISKVEFEDSKFKLQRSENSLKAYKSQIKQSEATVEAARTKLQYTKIKAPINGDVINIAVQAGQTLISSQQSPVLMTLAELDKLMVVTQVPEADIGKIFKGQEVSFTTLSAPNTPVVGIVEAIRPTAKNVKDAFFYEVISSLPNKDRKLFVDMTVQANFLLKMFKNVAVIPLSAIGPKENDQYKVHLLLPSGKVVDHLIRVGSDDHMQAHVVEGLKNGDTVMDPYLQESTP